MKNEVKFESKIHKRHLDNNHTILIVDGYYKIYPRNLLDCEKTPSELVEETLAQGWKYNSLLKDLEAIASV